MKKDILNINVFNGDDGIKYIKYDDMISMLNRIKEDNEERDKEIERLNNIMKEVREYIKENTTSYYTDLEHTNEEFELIGDPKELLEILDKADKEK